jgi:hypothetical protein
VRHEILSAQVLSPSGPRNEVRDETPGLSHTFLSPSGNEVRVPSVRGLLVNAAAWNVDREADISPIVELLNTQGCDLRLDVLPVVAREVPELPRPLRNWGAPWLVRKILAAGSSRLSGRANTVGSTPTAMRPPSRGGSGNKLNTASTTLMTSAFFRFSATHCAAVLGR